MPKFISNLERVEAEKLADVTIGEPQATPKRTVEQLQELDIVGIYSDTPPPPSRESRYEVR